MAGVKLLSETECKASKAKDKLYYLNDGGGLRLRIRPNGSRTWVYRYRLNGKERAVGLGSYPHVTLKIAREKAGEAGEIAQEGKNLSVENKLRKQQRAMEEDCTFGAVAREWIAHNKPDWSANHLKRNEGLVRRYLLPDLGRLPIQSIEERYLFSVLKTAYDRGRKESTRRARAIAAQIFTYGKDTHRCTINPARDMAGNSYFKRPITKHFTAISKEDVPSLISELRKTGSEQRLNPQTVCALLLVLYTGHRDLETRGAKWQEFDLIKQTWEVPGDRMKNRKAHRVSLPTQAIKALEEIKPVTFKEPESYVFPSKSKSGHMAENTLRLALHRLGYKVTIHGMRSLITNVLNEKGFNADAVERQLDHKEKNAVRAAYLRSEFEDVRRPMMQWFADWCEQGDDIDQTSKVVSIQGRR